MYRLWWIRQYIRITNWISVESPNIIRQSRYLSFKTYARISFMFSSLNIFISTKGNLFCHIHVAHQQRYRYRLVLISLCILWLRKKHTEVKWNHLLSERSGKTSKKVLNLCEILLFWSCFCFWTVTYIQENALFVV